MRTTLIGLAAAGCAILGLAGCGSTSPTTTTATTAATTEPATPTASAAPALTLGATGYSTAGVATRPLGFQLVTNATNQQAQTVDVTMTLSDAGGTVLDTEHGYAGVVRSGQTVGIVVDFLMNPSGGVAVKTVNVGVGQWAVDDMPAAVDTATAVSWSADSEFLANSGVFDVKGTVANKYATPQQNVMVAVACHDPAGHITGLSESSVAYVPANGTAVFSGFGSAPPKPTHCDTWAYPGIGG